MAANPVFAQDADTNAQATDDSSSAMADTSTDTTAADSSATAESPVADDGATSADAAMSDDSAVSGEADEPAAEPRKPFYAYAGVDYAFLHTSLSKDSLKNALGGDHFDSDFYRVRFGTRIFQQIGVERSEEHTSGKKM